MRKPLEISEDFEYNSKNHRHNSNMKKTLTFILLGAFALASTNCTTTYDAYGNPRNSVDPGTAVAGAAAVGVLGYALANKNNDKDRRRAYNRGYNDHDHRGHYDRRGRYHYY